MTPQDSIDHAQPRVTLPRQRLYTSPRSYAYAAQYILGLRRFDGGVRDLEREIAEHIGTKYAICTNQARAALYLGLGAILSRTEKREIILSPYTIFDVVNMVLAAGGVPVFADIEPDSCNISAIDVEKLINDHTAAVLVTHLHGIAADISPIRDLCQSNDIALVEDAAQALGSKINGRWLGTIGDAGVFSYGMMKNVVGFHGGMLVTDDPEIDTFARRKLADFAPYPRSLLAKRVAYGFVLDTATWPPLFNYITYPAFKYGFLHDVGAITSFSKSELNPQMRRSFPEKYRFRMTDVQARIILEQLDSIESDVKVRAEKAKLYYDRLSNTPGVVTPPFSGDGSQGYLAYPIQVPDRNDLLRHLFHRRRDCVAQHLKNCADLEAFSAYGRECPNARSTAKSTLLLPTYPRYQDSQILANITAIQEYFEHQGPQTIASTNQEPRAFV